MKLSEELRSKPSRDNRDLLNRAADRIDELETETNALRQLIVNIANEEIRVMTHILHSINEGDRKNDAIML